MSRKLWLALTLLAFLLLCIACILVHGEGIADALAGNGAVKAEQPIGTPPAAAISPSLLVTMENGKIVLRGTLPNQASKDNVIVRAKGLYGAGGFVDELKIDANAKIEKWVASASTLLPSLGKEMLSGSVKIKDGELVATGEMATQAGKDSYLKSLQDTFQPDITVIDKLTVAKEVTAEVVKTVQRDLDKELALEIVEFNTGSDVITPKGLATLDKVDTILKSAPNLTLEVGGHTDSVGDPAKNLDLSQKRAASVIKYMKGKGISDSLTPKGYGQTQPKFSNDTVAHKQGNRRIEFKIKK